MCANKIYSNLLKNQFQPQSSFSLTLLSHPLTLPFSAQTLSSHSLKQLSHPSHTSLPLSLTPTTCTLYSHSINPFFIPLTPLSLSLILLFSIIHSHHSLTLPFHQVLPHFYTLLSILYQPTLFHPTLSTTLPTISTHFLSLSPLFQPNLPNLSVHFLSLSPP